MIKILVAEPMALTREGLVALLDRESDIEVVAAVRRGDEVLPAARALKPDVCLLAAVFPEYDGIGIAREIYTELPVCRCAILSRDRQPTHLRLAIAAHVHGYLVHDLQGAFLVEAIRQLALGNKIIDPSLTFRVVGSKSSPLTLREAEALRAVAAGSTTQEVAANLCLTVGTIRNYLSRAIAKTGARNRVDAIRIANESGWL